MAWELGKAIMLRGPSKKLFWRAGLYLSTAIGDYARIFTQMMFKNGGEFTDIGYYP